MDFHATVLEVILIAGVGSYIGFLIGLRSGVFLAATGKNGRRNSRTPSRTPAKASAAEKTSTMAG